jgi:hypothetical protein
MGILKLKGAAISQNGAFFLLDEATNEVVVWSAIEGEQFRWKLPDRDACVEAIVLDDLWERVYVAGCRSPVYVFGFSGKYQGKTDYRFSSSLLRIDQAGRLYRSAGGRGIQVLTPTDP